MRRKLQVSWRGWLVVVALGGGSLYGQDKGTEVVIETDPAQPAAATSEDTTASTPAPMSSPEKSEADRELERLRKERERIAAENALAQEKLRQELFDLEAEKQRLTLQNGLRRERLDAEVAGLRTQLDRLQLDIDLINRTTSLENAKRREELERELAGLRAEEERLKLANAVAAQKLETRLAELRVQDMELKLRRARLDMDVAQLQTDLAVREKREVLRDLAPDERHYTTEPFKDGVLQISDRRISLNGPIVPAMADEIVGRINYFNNQSTEFPIFIVIDSSPGGSAMAGAEILKAMEGSHAPVYVVVRSYAASMAAIITALAERSFAYPNAVILHHQLSWIGFGNLTQQKQQFEHNQKFWRRLVEPVAQKMGLTLDAFIARMYEHDSDGNWREFGDVAKELKWVDEIAQTIWETGLDKNPDRFGAPAGMSLRLEEKVDADGRPYVLLPRLEPFDAYLVYNPDNYYRVR